MTLLFVVGFMPPTDSDLYLGQCLDSDEDLPPSFIDIGEIPGGLPAPDKSRLFYQINRFTNVYRLCIPPSVALDILAVAHEEGHPGFSRCYKIITRS